jgi:DhnA family fructose-bisphosphate aldolase class Ia
MDGGPTDLSSDPEATGLMCQVKDAVRLGADAVITSIWLGGEHEARTMTQAMRLAGECEAWGMPLLIETFMSSGVEITIDHIALISRIAAELGADIIKTYLRGDVKSYQKVTSTCFRPVVILGGEKSNDELQVLKWVKTAIDAGAAGSCIGRNVIQHKNPVGVIRALKAIIHEGAEINDVAGML